MRGLHLVTPIGVGEREFLGLFRPGYDFWNAAGSASSGAFATRWPA